jgi:uncharacterized membrane protein YdjX (TVP38/TMEM64 family)
MTEAIAGFIETLGPAMYVAAPLFMILVAILPFPAEVPAMLNGAIFGPVLGTMITWAGAMVGAQISFELANRFGRPLAARFLPRGMDHVDRVALSTGWGGLLTLRLIPAVAFTALNWAAGLTGIPRWRFMWTTAIGILPGAIVFTASGTGLAAFLKRYPESTPLMIGLALLVVTITAWRYSARGKGKGSGEVNAADSGAEPGV